jgi:hypothetical protein
MVSTMQYRSMESLSNKTAVVYIPTLDTIRVITQAIGSREARRAYDTSPHKLY